MTRINADNLFGLSQFIVDPSAAEGSFTTIQSAINAAVSGDVIFVKPGSYVESLVLKIGVDIIGVTADGRSPTATCTIIGLHTLTGNGFVVMQNFSMSAPAGNILTITGGPAQNPTLIVKNTQISSPIGMGGQLIGGGGTPGLILVDTGVNAQGIGFTVGDGRFSMENSTIGSATAEGISFLGSSSGNVTNNSNVTGQTTAITINNIGVSIDLVGSSISGQTAEAILFTAAGSVNSNNCVYNSNAGSGFYIAGAGAYQYAGDAIIGAATQIDPAVTQNPVAWRPFATSGTSLTAIKGTASFDSTAFTVTDGFIESTDQMITSAFSGVIDFLTLGATVDFFTVPAGKTFYPQSIVLETTALAGFVLTPNISFGTNTTYDDLQGLAFFGVTGTPPFINVIGGEFEAAGAVLPSPFVAGTTIGMKVQVAGTAAVWTGRAFITGVLK